MEDKLRLDALEKMINLIQVNVNFSLGLTWAILGVVIAVIGVALYFVAKMLVQQGVGKQLDVIKGELKQFIKDNPSILWAKGTATQMVSNSDGREFVVSLALATPIDKEHIILFELYHVSGVERKLITNYEIKAENNNLKVEYKIPGNPVTGRTDFLILWNNPLYDKM